MRFLDCAQQAYHQGCNGMDILHKQLSEPQVVGKKTHINTVNA